MDGEMVRMNVRGNLLLAGLLFVWWSTEGLDDGVLLVKRKRHCDSTDQQNSELASYSFSIVDQTSSTIIKAAANDD